MGEPSDRSRCVSNGLAPRLALLVVVFASVALSAGVATADPVGHPTFASPQAAPIERSPVIDELYVANTPGDTLDVIDTVSRSVLVRIPVGLDPVSVAVRPDGKEVWVSNHVSDTVSVIDVDPASATRYQVVATVTAWQDGDRQVTDFDEPVGLAFASDEKAYVALSSRNRIAVIDVPSRTVTKQIQVLAQEPRAIRVRGGRLYVIPFESGNQTELSGCAVLSDPGCTFTVLDLISNSNDVILTRNMVADIVRRPEAPDRDLFVYSTVDESPLFEVSSMGTLLYGLAVDSAGRVFVAQTEARNDANGLSGTAGHDLPEIENRMFLNQIARVDCAPACGAPTLVELEPLPPLAPLPSEELATPFGIQVSGDDSTIVAVAAGSSRLFTMDAATGAILGRTAVGRIPRGLALDSAPDGSPQTAWVLNAIDDSVSVVDVSDPSSPFEVETIVLDDPTHADVREGRFAFNNAEGSTTGTFSCASCHPDGNTDQLLWNLGARCITDGCDQAQPRTTMPIRGLRDTLPLHWDGVPGDPFGGINAELADSGLVADPNCDTEHSCFRDLVDGAMSGTMCDPAGCPSDENELGLAGAFDEAARDAMAVFLRSVPYPPARSRRFDDGFSALAEEGFRNFLIGIDEDHPGCSRAGVCHSLPFWAGTNTRGTGMDAPTFRGMTDRHLLLPNGRAGMWHLIRISVLNEVAWDPRHGPDELYSWGMTFGTEAFPITNRNSAGTGPFQLFQLFEEGSTGFAGALGRQVTLDATTAAKENVDETEAILARLERADTDRVVNLRVDGALLPSGLRLSLAFADGLYVSADATFDRQDLLDGARRGQLIATATARMGDRSDVDHPQPALWLAPDPDSRGRNKLQKIPELEDTLTIALFGRHVAPDAVVLIDGRSVAATVSCESGGTLPSCTEERLLVDLEDFPLPGDRRLQVVTPGGLLSNEVLVISHVCPMAPSFDGIVCRFGAFAESVEAADLGSLGALLRDLTGEAEEAIELALVRQEEGRDQRVRRQLKAAAQRLRSIVRRLDAKRGRDEVAEPVRSELVDEATILAEDLLTLREEF